MRIQNSCFNCNTVFRSSKINLQSSPYTPIKFQQQADLVDLKTNSIQQNKIKNNQFKPFGISFTRNAASTVAQELTSHESIIKLGLDNIRAKYKKIIELFPEDAHYYKQMAVDMGLKDGEEFRLLPIVGRKQLKNILSTASSTDFSINHDFSGVKNLTARINLHNHTQASDGKLSVEEFLEQARKYADKTAEKNPEKPYMIAITDHDILDGGQNAARIIAQDPYKYRNLKLVIGSEISVSHINPEDVKAPMNFELIAYSTNPFNKNFNGFLQRIREGRNTTAKTFLNEINEQSPGLNLNWEEAGKFAANLGKGTSNGSLWLTRDYAIFKSHLKLYTDQINARVIKDSDKKLNADALMQKLANDYYLKSDQKLVNGITNYFEKFGVDGYKAETPELKAIFSSRIDENKVNEINRLMAKHQRTDVSMINPETTVTPEQVFDAYRESGDSGMFGIAHPGFLQAGMYSDKIADHCKGRSDREPAHHLVWVLFNRLLHAGQNLFQCSETNYQSYGSDASRGPWIEYVNKISKEIGLSEAGGVDCHTKCLFSKHSPISNEKIKELGLEDVVGVI